MESKLDLKSPDQTLAASGANTQGETLDDVREKLFEAMQMILEANREEAESRLSGKPSVTREQLTLHAA